MKTLTIAIVVIVIFAIVYLLWNQMTSTGQETGNANEFPSGIQMS